MPKESFSKYRLQNVRAQVLHFFHHNIYNHIYKLVVDFIVMNNWRRTPSDILCPLVQRRERH